MLFCLAGCQDSCQTVSHDLVIPTIGQMSTRLLSFSPLAFHMWFIADSSPRSAPPLDEKMCLRVSNGQLCLAPWIIEIVIASKVIVVITSDLVQHSAFSGPATVHFRSNHLKSILIRAG